MPGTPMPYVKIQFFDNNGVPAASHSLFGYKAGTSTKIPSWSENPKTLDAAGRTVANLLTVGNGFKFILSPSGDSDPPESPVWTFDNVAYIPFAGPSTTITKTGTAEAWSTSDTVMTLTAPDRPVVLRCVFLDQVYPVSPTITIPAGTLEPIVASSGDGIVCEWETDYSSATLSARATAFGTAVDAGTGAASTMTRARYVFYRTANTTVHVSTEVIQNTGAGNVQIAAGQQSIAGLDLDNTDYTIELKMASGTYSRRGARVYFGKAYSDWQDL